MRVLQEGSRAVESHIEERTEQKWMQIELSTGTWIQRGRTERILTLSRHTEKIHDFQIKKLEKNAEKLKGSECL